MQETIQQLINTLEEMKDLGILLKTEEDYQLSQSFNERRQKLKDQKATKFYTPLMKVRISKQKLKDLPIEYLEDSTLDALTILSFLMEKEAQLKKTLEELNGKKDLTFWNKFLKGIKDSRDKLTVLGKLTHHKEKIVSYTEIIQEIRSEK